MRYGFVIDQTRCIGCHACTVACKEENRVPLGAFRTWVKYVERGAFPHTRRSFSVLRCNHCDRAPCVAICPTVALYRRPDGIVDFDPARCIGCKSCMQACPYDALYIDPGTGTAAKCHYCAHRVEVGLLPACVVVCPEQAIIAGDLDDPRSAIAGLVASAPLQVRKAEQGTLPKVFYLGADAAALTPSLQAPSREYVWAERPPEEHALVDMVSAAQAAAPGADAATSRVVYDVPHLPRPWGVRVSAYLWTKAVAAGSLLVVAPGVLAGGAATSSLATVAAPALALLFLALTTGLLVLDLKRPERFHFILLKPNVRSWLVWGAWVLMAYGAVALAWLWAGLAAQDSVLRLLAVPVIVLAVGAAGYSAFLFHQAEGRRFWQSPLLLPHLVVAALTAGAAALALVGFLTGATPEMLRTLAMVMALGLVGQALVLAAELLTAHTTVDAARAARVLTRGRLGRRFWWGAVGSGIVLPLALVWVGPSAAALAAVLALAGLWAYEDAWLAAGQAIPLS